MLDVGDLEPYCSRCQSQMLVAFGHLSQQNHVNARAVGNYIPPKIIADKSNRSWRAEENNIRRSKMADLYGFGKAIANNEEDFDQIDETS